MEEDYFTYKVVGWFLMVFLTLQPAAACDSLPDNLTATANTETPFYQEPPACIDEAQPLQTVFALRLRSQHAPQPGTNMPSARLSLFEPHYPQPHLPASAHNFIRRRSTLCIYRI